MTTPHIAFLTSDADWQTYGGLLQEALAPHDLTATLQFGPDTPEAVDYIIYAPVKSPTALPVDFAGFTRAKAVLSLWAGVERIINSPGLTMPLCRMVDPSLQAAMVEYVAGHVLRYHLGMDQFISGQDGIWRNDHVPPLATHRRVAILGLGELGRASAAALRGLGFQIAGWSRSPRQIEGITCHSGPQGLREILGWAEIIITLLPLTPDTENLLGTAEFAAMRAGAMLINPGRGALLDDAALLAALDAGQIAHATLDVFRTEPLPPADPFWAHPKVTVTPHIAAATHPQTAVRQVAENIRRGESGLPFLHQVDRGAGY